MSCEAPFKRGISYECRTHILVRKLIQTSDMMVSNLTLCVVNTVRPLLSGHPPLSGQSPDLFVSKLLYLIPLFNGHLFAVASVLFLWFFTSIKRPANYLSLKYLELNFFTYHTVDAKRPKKFFNDVLHFFCTLSTRRNTVHFNYEPSVLELELLMGWKCT